MSECSSIDPLVTPYVDGELLETDRALVDRHLQACGVCRSRIVAERAVHELFVAQRRHLCATAPPAALLARCRQSAARVPAPYSPRRSPFGNWRSRPLPLALAATLVVLLAGAGVYQLTQTSVRVMAAELAADHVRCFIMYGSSEGAPVTTQSVEQSLADQFGWNATLPAEAEALGLELIGARPCLYGAGRVAHILYRYEGRPVSVFMLPDTERAQDLFEVFGHRAVAWTSDGRSFVLVAREPAETMERLARVVHAGLH